MEGLEKVVSHDTNIYSRERREHKARKPNVSSWGEIEGHLGLFSACSNRNNAVYITLNEVKYGEACGWSFVEHDRQDYFQKEDTQTADLYDRMIDEFGKLLGSLSLKSETDAERFEGKSHQLGRYRHVVWLTQLPSVQQLQTIAQIPYVTEIGLVSESDYKPRWFDK